MSQLPPELRHLLDDAQRSHGPSANDRERVLARLHASLGMVPVLTATNPAEAASSGLDGPSGLEGPSSFDLPSLSGPPAATGLSAGKTALLGKTAGALLKWKAGKVLLASLALGGAVGAGVSTLPSREPAPRARTEETTPVEPASTVETRAPIERRARTERERARERRHDRAAARQRRANRDESKPASETPSASSTSSLAMATSDGDDNGWLRVPSEVESASEAARARAESSRPQAGTGTPAATADQDEDAVAAPARRPARVAPERAVEELALIRRALTSLRDQDPKRALVLLNEHASDHPQGAFATERRGLRVVALCAAGHVEQGREERRAFLAQAGSSPVAERVRRACRDEGGSGKP